MNEEPQNLMDGLFEQMERVRELITQYKALPKGVGMIGAGLMTVDVKMAEKAIASGDVIQMLVCYENLKSCE